MKLMKLKHIKKCPTDKVEHSVFEKFKS